MAPRCGDVRQYSGQIDPFPPRSFPIFRVTSSLSSSNPHVTGLFGRDRCSDQARNVTLHRSRGRSVVASHWVEQNGLE
jgi:hypothetical protein